MEPTTTTIRARREALGLTRAELAVRAGCSLTWMANLESGLGSGRSMALRRVEKVLGDLEAEQPAAA